MMNDHEPMHPPREPIELELRAGALADAVTARLGHALPVRLSERLVQRFDVSGSPGLRAAAFSRRFATRTLQGAPVEMTLSPYAPPQRQISAVRQGVPLAPMWRPASGDAPADAPEPNSVIESAPKPAPPRVAPQDPDELPADLQSLLDLHRRHQRI
jgi:hypothetical protein